MLCCGYGAAPAGARVWLEDNFDVKNNTLWNWASVAAHFCSSYLLVAPSGELLQEVASQQTFALPAAGAQGVVIEGSVGDTEALFSHIFGLSICDRFVSFILYRGCRDRGQRWRH